MATQTLDIKHAGKHLKLDNDQLQVKTSQAQMPLKVKINKGPATGKPSKIILWFPDTNPDPLFVGPKEILIKVFPTSDPKVWEGDTVLTVNTNYPKGVVPYAIFCDIDGGQEGQEDPEFDQRGRQMVDGKHSHPDCNVGP